MFKRKFICAYCILSSALAATQTRAFKTDEILPAFHGLVECDGSKRAEIICKQNCTGDGLVLKGTCSDPSIWNQCLTICRKDWIENCAQTAANYNLQGLPYCQ